ncbi:MAG TPA: hypothetical protein VKQ36_10540, partial [Ktedonobacterales bacterium]|nr:hypothetical protein [Ktedonobacterales bacterium]
MQALLDAIHLFLVWPVLVAGGVSLILGLFILIRHWRQLAPAPTQSTDAASATVPSVAPESQAVGLRRVFRWALIVTAALGVLQVVMGGLLFLIVRHPPDDDPLHFVYGAIVLLAIPVAYAYSGQKQVRRVLIIMTIALVALVGAAVR